MYRIWCMTDIKIEKVVVLALEGPHITIREIIKYTNGPQYAQEWAKTDARMKIRHAEAQIQSSDWDPHIYREGSVHSQGSTLTGL